MPYKAFRNIFYILPLFSILFAYAKTDEIYTIKQVVVIQDSDIPSIIAKENNIAMVFYIELSNTNIKDIENISNLISSHVLQSNIIFTIPKFSIQANMNIDTNFGNVVFEKKQDSLSIVIPQDDSINHAKFILDKNKLYLVILTNKEILQNKDIKLDSVNKQMNAESNALLNDSTYELSSWRYFLVLGIMFAILILLYFIRLRQNRGKEISNISIEQAKILDSKNKIIVISHGKTKYILGLNPNGITLIDRLDSKQSSEIESNDIQKENEQCNNNEKSQVSFKDLL